MGTKGLGWMAAAACILCAACAAKTPPVVRQEPPVPVVSEVRPRPAAGAIWPGENSMNMMFTDRKARHVNDTITILIVESAAGGSKGSTNTSRASLANSNITALLGMENQILNNNANMNGKIEIGGGSTNSLKGSGDTSRDGSLRASLTARVVRVLENGNLLLEGRRHLTINNENEFIIVSGMVRPEDISVNNSVESRYLADARIVYTGSGMVDDKMRGGWLTKGLDWIWPF